jgi:hypothetical protein
LLFNVFGVALVSDQGVIRESIDCCCSGWLMMFWLFQSRLKKVG